MELKQIFPVEVGQYGVEGVLKKMLYFLFYI